MKGLPSSPTLSFHTLRLEHHPVGTRRARLIRTIPKSQSPEFQKAPVTEAAPGYTPQT